MSDRDHVRQAIDGLWDFGRALDSKLSADRSTVWVTIEEVGDEPIPAQELWGTWAILTRPAAPDADGRSAEVMYLRRSGEIVGVASRDTRWQVADLEAGGVIVRAMGAAAATIRLRPNGTLEIDGVGDFVPLASKVDDAIARLKTATSTALSGIPAVGGALQTAFNAALIQTNVATGIQPTKSAKVKIGG
jgi:hypothetical protein